MKFLGEMAKYHQQRHRYLYSGIDRFMKYNEEIFRKYDPTLRAVDTGYEHIEITAELTEKQAEALSNELIKADDKWYAELEEFGYGGYIQDFD